MFVCNMFVCNRDVHMHNTRAVNSIHIPLVRTNLGKTGIRYFGSIIWNKILNVNIPLTSDYTFSKKLKQYIINGVI